METDASMKECPGLVTCRNLREICFPTQPRGAVVYNILGYVVSGPAMQLGLRFGPVRATVSGTFRSGRKGRKRQEDDWKYVTPPPRLKVAFTFGYTLDSILLEGQVSTACLE